MSVPSTNTVSVVSPSRLHFGLLSFGAGQERQFGGVGAMIENPGLELIISKASCLETTGSPNSSLPQRAADFARSWATYHAIEQPLPCHIEIVRAPRQHIGLGVGTQLALSVASGLNAFFQLPSQSSSELAVSVGRGQRSAVGAYGFSSGGLIVERGKTPGQRISPLDCRIEISNQWRFVLLCPRDDEGLCGNQEQSAFDKLPPVDEKTTAKLTQIVRDQLVPAAAGAEFQTFSRSLYEYGHLAGLCFAPIQEGAYNGPRLIRLVELIRSLGIEGVGQSSWGPTLYSLLPCQSEAEEFVDRLRKQLSEEDVSIWISRPNNCGSFTAIQTD